MNGNATGYRETYKSVSSQKSGQPAQKSKEYQVEYLNPSNSTSIAHERPKSPFFEHVSESDLHFFFSNFNNLYEGFVF